MRMTDQLLKPAFASLWTVIVEWLRYMRIIFFLSEKSGYADKPIFLNPLKPE